mmetsp:Transcript_6795/g.17318  ORF Transcript_6795/g.17318 Transcript_6795/m.17318 type:complete len:116 (-) Transcript_6795:127-474(-)
MLGALRVARVAAQRTPALHVVAAPRLRKISGIRIIEEKGKAAEKLYWAQEDERLLKKMLEAHPELDPAYQGLSNMLSDGSMGVADKVKHVFAKHGIPPVNKALVDDIVALVEHKN